MKNDSEATVSSLSGIVCSRYQWTNWEWSIPWVLVSISARKDEQKMSTRLCKIFKEYPIWILPVPRYARKYTDGRNYLRIIFLKNIDFSVKTICKDKYLQKCLHKDASEEDIFTASFWKFFLKKFKHFRKESSIWRFKESLLWLWNKSLIEFEKTSLKTSPILKVQSDFEGIKRGLCIEILIEISGNGKRSECLPSQRQVTLELGSAGPNVNSSDLEQRFNG